MASVPGSLAAGRSRFGAVELPADSLLWEHILSFSRFNAYANGLMQPCLSRAASLQL